MKPLMTFALIALIATTTAHAADPAPASQRKDCTVLRTEIADQLAAKGVRHYRLEIVAPEALGEAREVGRCDGGTRRIAYTRLTAADAAASDQPAATPASAATDAGR